VDEMAVERFFCENIRFTGSVISPTNFLRPRGVCVMPAQPVHYCNLGSQLEFDM
jgi:hypothetical protein